MEQLNNNMGINKIVDLMGTLTTEELKEIEEKAKEKRLCNIEIIQKRQKREIEILKKVMKI